MSGYSQSRFRLPGLARTSSSRAQEVDDLPTAASCSGSAGGPRCDREAESQGTGRHHGHPAAPERCPPSARVESRCRLTATVTATAAANGKRQRPATAHNSRATRANLAYARPEKRTVAPRQAATPMFGTERHPPSSLTSACSRRRIARIRAALTMANLSFNPWVLGSSPWWPASKHPGQPHRVLYRCPAHARKTSLVAAPGG